jgi:NADH-quinone oxidoreductase subunit G
MPTVLIDNIEVPLGDKERLNGIQVARRAGIEIPHYCWHAGLSVVASCRMCLVECGKKDDKTGKIAMQPRLVPACQTPATDGTVFPPSDRLPHLRQSRRMLAAGLPLRARSEGAAGGHSALHKPPPQPGRNGHTVCRSLRDVYPLRPLHP